MQNFADSSSFLVCMMTFDPKSCSVVTIPAAYAERSLNAKVPYIWITSALECGTLNWSSSPTTCKHSVRHATAINKRTTAMTGVK